MRWRFENDAGREAGRSAQREGIRRGPYVGHSCMNSCESVTLIVAALYSVHRVKVKPQNE